MEAPGRAWISQPIAPTLKLGEREVAAGLLGLTAEDWKRRGNMSYWSVWASTASMRA